ncbi:MAG: phosphoglycolate phosphatase [Rhodobacterales bacterium]|nr:phosphoglycolate phosphatase [Rhodobacterales bacterium]
MKTIIFDLDGTLIHSAPDLHASANKMLADEGHAPVSLDLITSFIGNGVPRLVELVIGHCGLDMADHDRLVASYLAHYDAGPVDLTELYPNLEAALIDLKAAGYTLGVCTNKPEAPARQILDLLDLTQYFDVVIGGDALPVKKPDPAPLNKAFADVDASEKLYVGDSEVDAETARAAGIDFALFTEGYRKTPIANMPHKYSFSDFSQFGAIVETAFSGGS